MSKHKIDECCEEMPEFVDSVDLQPGVAINVYLCKKCNTSHKYRLIYPLVHYGNEDSSTIFQNLGNSLTCTNGSVHNYMGGTCCIECGYVP